MPAARTSARPFALAAILVVASAHGAPVAAGNLVRNGSFDAQPNPLAFWTNASEALATWASDGASGSQGSVQLRFLPPGRADQAILGAVYFTGLTQCVSLPGAGPYALAGYARVAATASPSSIAGIRWVLRTNGPACIGAVTQSGSVGFPRSTAWTASFPSLIQFEASEWTVGTTLEIQLQAGDSSTQTVEALEAFIDEVTLEEQPFFGDGFEG